MDRYHTEQQVVIAADAETVWSVIAEFGRYSEWSSGIQELNLKTSFAEGASGNLVFLNGAAKRKSLLFKIVKVAEGEYLEWQGYPRYLRWAVRGNHYHRIEQLSAEQVRFTHGEYFSGLAAGLAWKLAGESYIKGYIRNTAAIKVEAEKRYLASVEV